MKELWLQGGLKEINSPWPKPHVTGPYTQSPQKYEWQLSHVDNLIFVSSFNTCWIEIWIHCQRLSSGEIMPFITMSTQNHRKDIICTTHLLAPFWIIVLKQSQQSILGRSSFKCNFKAQLWESVLLGSFGPALGLLCILITCLQWNCHFVSKGWMSLRPTSKLALRNQRIIKQLQEPASERYTMQVNFG